MKMDLGNQTTEEEKYLKLYKSTMAHNTVGKRIIHKKNVHSVGFEHEQNLKGFVFTDIKDEGTKSEREAGEEINQAIQASSSAGGLFAWKCVGRQSRKLEVKVQGNPNKLKNHSVVRIKSVGKDVKRYGTTTGSTFTQKKIEMVNRRMNFDTSKPNPLYCSTLQEDLKKSLITPWKKPENWLHSFKPGVKSIQRSESQKVFTPKIDKYYTSIDLKANKLEMKSPNFCSSMKETFVPQKNYIAADKTHQKYKRVFGKASFSMGNYDLTKRIPETRRSLFCRLDEDRQERGEENKKNWKTVEINDAKVTRMPSNLEPKNKTSCHAKFFKAKSKKLIKMSFQEFLKANKFNKEKKQELLETHYKLGEKDDKGGSLNQEFLTEKKGEEWTHIKYTEDEPEEELLRKYFKRRELTQNFTFKSDVHTEDFDCSDPTKTRLIDTPRLDKTSKLDTSKALVKSHFKLGHQIMTRPKTAKEVYRSKSMPVIPESADPGEEVDPQEARIAEVKAKFQEKRVKEIKSMKKMAEQNFRRSTQGSFYCI
ncbi:unnamed protein product [Moneuplotes crassus]|uniref:Uncharacterized protein n=1 Tax=Euplotes crassus TaxID=5936 RepID=A0AAD1Y8S2_EUPCR|nr:unnamed protein product [Moneuplotes crassus]